jgi:hypothetical protein
MTLEGLNEDFRDVLVLFVDAGVEFVVVGAYALAFHGAPRASGDIDVFVRPSLANARRVADALRRFGAPLASSGIKDADFIGREALVRNKEATGRLKDRADVEWLQRLEPPR